MALYANYNNGADFEREILPAGMYKVRCNGIEEKSGEYGVSWMWKLETVDRTRTDGKPFWLTLFTNTSYGSDKARLTKLIDSLYGRRFTAEEWSGFDVQKLEGHEYNAMVVKSNKGGEERNNVETLIPVDYDTLPMPPNASNGKAAPPAAAADDEEPPVLTEKQRASLAKRLKLSEDEAQSMDIRGRMPGDEGYDPYEGDN